MDSRLEATGTCRPRQRRRRRPVSGLPTVGPEPGNDPHVSEHSGTERASSHQRLTATTATGRVLAVQCGAAGGPGAARIYTVVLSAAAKRAIERDLPETVAAAVVDFLFGPSLPILTDRQALAIRSGGTLVRP
jgi:hypothetical protein